MKVQLPISEVMQTFSTIQVLKSVNINGRISRSSSIKRIQLNRARNSDSDALTDRIRPKFSYLRPLADLGGGAREMHFRK